MPELDQIYCDINFLSQKCRATTREEMKELGIVARLISAMQSGWTGAIGLAAIQIGVPICAAVYIPNRIKPELSNDPVTLVNPVLKEYRNLQPYGQEGCLSLPSQRVLTYRYRNVVVETGYDDNRKIIEAEGLEAIVLQHEIDHMDGILNVHRGRAPRRNEICPCGSVKKFKVCHGR